MKRLLKKRIALLLAITAIISSLTFFGCSDSTPEETSPIPDTSEESTLPDETTADADADKTKISIGNTDISDYVIIHNGSACSSAAAIKVRDAIQEYTGCRLATKKDSSTEKEYEILVGKTNRKESAEIRAKYSRPNVYYSIAVCGTKLVLMGEGNSTLEELSDEFDDFLKSNKGKDITLEGNVKSGDIIAQVDKLNVSMVNRAEGTDLRILHWNMAAPYLDPNVTPPPVVYTNNKIRGEVMADAILQLMPDIISTNEFYESHNGNTVFFDAVMGELSEYYVCLDSPYDKDKPEDGATAISGKTINSNIIYRKDAGLEVITSSWRYSTEKTTTSSSNPKGYVYYHGSHTALFSYNGRKFILSTSHYADSRSSSKWASEHLDAIADMQKKSGEASDLPVILTGDLYTGYTSSSPDSGYKYLVKMGYIDSQRNAEVNANNNPAHGTFHTIGEKEINRISEDFVWHTSELKALCFKVLTSKVIDDSSDHYPVMADLKFN